MVGRPSRSWGRVHCAMGVLVEAGGGLQTLKRLSRRRSCLPPPLVHWKACPRMVWADRQVAFRYLWETGIGM
jgi:hypothetical protein